MTGVPDRDATLLTAALAAAARGWPVFPVVPGGKAPLVRSWPTRATCDPMCIEQSWAGRVANVGIACGPAGLVVLDLDVDREAGSSDVLTRDPDTRDSDTRDPDTRPGSGAASLSALAAGRPVPSTYTVSTPSGGRHLYFAAPAEVGLRNTASTLGPKIDTRAHGGYVLAAGSRTPAGIYRAPDHAAAVAPLPDWLGAALMPPAPDQVSTPTLPAGTGRRARYVDAAVRAELDRVRRAEPGTRNHTLFVAAAALGQLVAAGALDPTQVTTALRAVAAAHVSAGAYSHQQGDQTIASGLRAGATRPRPLPHPAD